MHNAISIVITCAKPVSESLENDDDCYSPFLGIGNPESIQDNNVTLGDDEAGFGDHFETSYPDPNQPLDLSGQTLIDLVHWELEGF